MNLLASYLEWQSEMGLDEVILPHPLARRHSRQPETLDQGSHGVETYSAGAPHLSPDHRIPAIKTSPGDALPVESFHLAPPASPDAASSLFKSLSQALDSAAQNARSAFATQDTPGPGISAVQSGGAPLSVLPGWKSLSELNAYVSSQAEILYPGSGQATGSRTLPGRGPAAASLALVGMEPSAVDIEAGLVFSGDVGELLDKMMRAIRMDPDQLYRTVLIKTHVPGKNWSRRELVRMLPVLHAELGLLKAPATLLLGEVCAQAVLKTGKPLEELRQAPHRMEGREYVVTYHPADLLRQESLKRKAWEDLQWLQKRLAEGMKSA